ncbi:hypothetical protein SHIRM173S_03410 [Streptomyces hirsutus]
MPWSSSRGAFSPSMGTYGNALSSSILRGNLTVFRGNVRPLLGSWVTSRSAGELRGTKAGGLGLGFLGLRHAEVYVSAVSE